jgi:hypothetical protein
MMEDAKLYKKDIYGMYADFKGAFNAVDHRIMFKHMRQLGMPPTFVDTCEQLYGVSTTNYIPPTASPLPSTLTVAPCRGTPSPPSYSPFSSNHSSAGS